jgi:hypothetical protein
LETLFWPENNQKTQGYQRIWDPNQAIYHTISSEENERANNLREKAHILENSLRFHKNIAKVVWCVALVKDNPKLNINMQWNCDCSENCSCIKPYLIVYTRTKDVLETYTQLINKHMYRFNTEDIQKIKKPYRAIWWIWKEAIDWGLRIPDYLETYSKLWSQKRNSYEYMSDYIYHSQDNNWLRNKQNAILRIRSKVIRTLWWAILSTRELVKTFREQIPVQKYEETKTKMYKWCTCEYDEELHKDILWYIISFTDDYKELFDLETIDTKNDRYKEFTTFKVQSNKDKARDNKSQVNVFSSNNVDIHIWTIHSVKWETHIATLYLETKYHRNRSHDWCDTTRMIEILTDPKQLKKKYHKQTAKMMYVWLSRPKSLLCLAIHSNRVAICVSHLTLWIVQICISTLFELNTFTWDLLSLALSLFDCTLNVVNSLYRSFLVSIVSKSNSSL